MFTWLLCFKLFIRNYKYDILKLLVVLVLLLSQQMYGFAIRDLKRIASSSGTRTFYKFSVQSNITIGHNFFLIPFVL